MIAFAHLDDQGLPTGGGMLPALPPGAVELPTPWTTVDLPRLRFCDGVWVERTDLEPTAPPSAEEIAAFDREQLARARTEAVAQVNARVEAFRTRFATPGQSEIYAVKLAQAQSLVATTLANWREPVDLAPWPAIAGEVGITAPTAWEVAQIILHQADRARAALIASEAPRQAALAAIAGAFDPEALSPIVADLIRALTGLSIQEP